MSTTNVEIFSSENDGGGRDTVNGVTQSTTRNSGEFEGEAELDPAPLGTFTAMQLATSMEVGDRDYTSTPQPRRGFDPGPESAEASLLNDLTGPPSNLEQNMAAGVSSESDGDAELLDHTSYKASIAQTNVYIEITDLRDLVFCLFHGYPSSNVTGPGYWARATSIVTKFTLVVVILSVINQCLETVSTIPLSATENAIEYFCVAWFVIDYLTRLACSRSRLAFVKNANSIIDAVAILPFFVDLVPSVNNVRGLAAIRVLRLLRVTRVLRHSSDGIFEVIFAMKNAHSALSLLFFLLFIALLVWSTALYLSVTVIYDFDNDHNVWVKPDGTLASFQSMYDAMWFVMTTMATVGYNNRSIDSGVAKAFASLTMITGVFVITFPTVILSGSFHEAYSARFRLLLLRRIRAAQLKAIDYSKRYLLAGRHTANDSRPGSRPGSRQLGSSFGRTTSFQRQLIDEQAGAAGMDDCEAVFPLVLRFNKFPTIPDSMKPERKRYRSIQLNQHDEEIARVLREESSGERREKRRQYRGSGEEGGSRGNDPGGLHPDHGEAVTSDGDDDDDPLNSNEQQELQEEEERQALDIMRVIHMSNGNFAMAEDLSISPEGVVTYPPRLRLECIRKTNIIRARFERIFPAGSYAVHLNVLLDDMQYNTRRREDATLRYGEMCVRSVKLAPILKLKIEMDFDLTTPNPSSSSAGAATADAGERDSEPPPSNSARQAGGEDAGDDLTASMALDAPILASCYVCSSTFEHVETSFVPIMIVCPSEEAFAAFQRYAHRLVLSFELTFVAPLRSRVQTTDLLGRELHVDPTDVTYMNTQQQQQALSDPSCASHMHTTPGNNFLLGYEAGGDSFDVGDHSREGILRGGNGVEDEVELLPLMSPIPRGPSMGNDLQVEEELANALAETRRHLDVEVTSVDS